MDPRTAIKICTLAAASLLIQCSRFEEPCHSSDAGCAFESALLYELSQTGAAGSSGYTAVGDQGRVYVSPDGQTWTLAASLTTDDLIRVATDGAGNRVALTAAGEIFYSRDSVNWSRQVASTSFTVANLQYLDGAFHAMGSGGQFLISSDGLAWSQLDIALAVNITGYAIRSTDGLRALSLGTGSGTTYARSPDPLTAKNFTPTNVGVTTEAVLAYGNRFFFLETGDRRVRSTEDFSTNIVSLGTVTPDLVGIVLTGSKLVTVADANEVGTSSTGTESVWPARGATGCGAGSPSFRDILYANQEYLIFGSEGGAGLICASDSGEPGTFSDRASTAGPLRSMIYSN